MSMQVLFLRIDIFLLSFLLTLIIRGTFQNVFSEENCSTTDSEPIRNDLKVSKQSSSTIFFRVDVSEGNFSATRPFDQSGQNRPKFLRPDWSDVFDH